MEINRRLSLYDLEFTVMVNLVAPCLGEELSVYLNLSAGCGTNDTSQDCVYDSWSHGCACFGQCKGVWSRLSFSGHYIY
jgi:hypothetical protein